MIRSSSLIVAVALAGAAAAQQSTSLGGGATTVQLSSDFVGAVRALGLQVTPLRRSSLYGWQGKFYAQFPISDGEIDLATAKGEIFHTGGLSLRAGATRVQLRAFNIDTTGAAPVLSGLVVANDAVVGRLPLFNIGLPAGFRVPLQARHGFLVLNGVRLTLTTQAASALNGAFGVTAFTGGFNIGNATVGGRILH
jgi:hypothetical protein